MIGRGHALVGLFILIPAGPGCSASAPSVHDALSGAQLAATAAREQEPSDDGTTASLDPLDAMIGQMTLAQKVGQLFLLTFSGSSPEDAVPALVDLNAGGIAFLDNVASADAARALTAGLQEVARRNDRIPPLIAVDHEGGSVQRIRIGVTVFGDNWDVGQNPLPDAIADACRRGDIHGQELAAIGIQMNLAPVLDIWDNPRNTVIGHRSFSANAEVVAQLGSAYIRAMQGHGVLAVGKHFPGHGSTDEDSHATLPIWPYDRATLDASELVPFRAAIQADVAAIMTAHVSYPNIDGLENRPASLSPGITTDLLRGDLGFEGLVITDDLGAMQAVTGQFDAGESAVLAFLAGNDMLTVVGSVDRQRRMVDAITAEVGRRIDPDRLDRSVRRILRAKQRAGLLPSQSVAQNTGSPSAAPGC